MWQSSYNNKATLYLIPTPIGNLEDITLRAIKILKEVEVLFCEDTRITLLLLNHLGIKKKLISLHEYNEEEVKTKVLEYLENNKNVGLVTDRGTPIISDPGYKTVKYIANNNYNVVSLPGPTAFVPAITASGIESNHFLFYGFLNSKESKKKEELEELKDLNYSIIFYEAPHRIKKTMSLILDVFGNRNISISREISKKYESIYRGDIINVMSTLEEIKGEFVIVVEKNNEVEDYSKIDIIENVDIYIRNGMSVMDSIKKVAKERKITKNIVYDKYHKRSEK